MRIKRMRTIHKIWLLVMLVLSASASFSQGGAAINTTGAVADPSAIFDASSNTQGLLMPRMTTLERNAINSPANGLMIINTTANCIEVYFNSIWQSVYCSCNPPSSPAAGTHNSTQTEIAWSWNTVSGATGYKYNTINDYNTAIDNGTNTSYTQTGLTCNTSYDLYVWSYSTCGHSSVATLTQTTSQCFTCGVTGLTFTYRGVSVTYGTVVGQNNTCWLDRNLGATAVATAYNHFDAYGDWFQWGRLDDGHQDRSSSVTFTKSSTDVPGHSNFINSSSSTPYDWRSPQNNNLWQGVNGINNPCPAGWRLPNDTELSNELSSWSAINYNGAFASPLKWTVSGHRDIYGSPENVGTVGYYWSSSYSGVAGRNMYFTSSNGAVSSNDRGPGQSVRCLKD